ncbi:site-specific integrase [Brevibacillus humidisoli]|uniref:site-specific integrase n=1 Tax=Brevibacillus humidisoli TaxID=2895522 RepID=UPI001E5A13B4|nr:site-specific integrase [Brevibacillus humidisoli]UFJ41709.1 site-specific integrase [Brevibacillus humidisoli]
MAGRTVKKDGSSWYFVLTVGKKENGKQKQIKRRGFKTKQEAIKAMNELEHSINQGTYVKPSKILYKEYLERWLEDRQTRVKKQTLETYTWLVNKHIIPALGNVELSKLNAMMIQQLLTKLTKDQSLSDENIQKVYTLINASLKQAERWGLIPKNPAFLVDRPKATKKQVKVWDVPEVTSFLEHAKGSRYYIAFLLAVTTGMRQGEILALQWKDIDFENGFLRVTQILSHDGKEILPYTKTKSGTRTIDLPDETIAELKKHKVRIAKEKLAAGPNLYTDLDLVVCSEIGTPTNAGNIRRAFNTAIEKANVSKIRFHDLRHTHATLLLKQGANPKIVAERLGHADTRITLDTYSHLLPSMQKETAKQFGRMLFGGTNSNNNSIENAK